MGHKMAEVCYGGWSWLWRASMCCDIQSNGAYGENDEGEIARHAVKGAAQ